MPSITLALAPIAASAAQTLPPASHAAPLVDARITLCQHVHVLLSGQPPLARGHTVAIPFPGTKRVMPDTRDQSLVRAVVGFGPPDAPMLQRSSCA